MNLIELQTFVDAAKAGSFAETARLTGLPKSTISRRVARLEEALGVSLFVRSHPRLSLTQDGRLLFQATVAPLKDIEDAGRLTKEGSGMPSGTLSLNAPTDIGSTPWFSNLITGYLRQYPEVRVQLRLTSTLPDFLSDGIDLALRPCNEGHYSSLMARRLEPFSGGLYASPAFVNSHGQLENIEWVEQTPCITHIGAPFDRSWLMRGPNSETRTITINPVFAANDFNAIAQAILHGLGVGLLPSIIAQPLIATHQLVPILPAWTFQQSELWLLWPESRHMSARVRSFVDYAVAAPH